MEILNRTLQPTLNSINKIKIAEADKHVLSNGIKMFCINAGTQPILKIDLMFAAGDMYGEKKIIGQAANHLIDDGTGNLTSLQIAAALESYGAEIACESDADYGYITVFVLQKYLGNILPVICSVLDDASYPDSEIEVYAKRVKQQIIINEEKVEYLSSRGFAKELFGADHFYGRYQKPDDVDFLNRQSLLSFNNTYYKKKPFTIIISGQITHAVLKQCENYFGQLAVGFDAGLDKMDKVSFMKPAKSFVVKEGAIQNAIKIGKPVIDRSHPDYPLLALANTILGGYFGSRLMSNIREDKGYTYGIYSRIYHKPYASYFSIATEVGSEVCKAALNEIYSEIKLLSEKRIEPNELMLVKNYINGTFLKSIDGPFGLSQVFKVLLIHNLDYTYYYNYLKTIETASSDDIARVSKQYLNPEQMTEVVAGNQGFN